LEQENNAMKTTRYLPNIFDVQSIDQAKRIILTPEGGLNSEERWQIETPILANDVLKVLSPCEDSLLLDYGCGLGRIAKNLIESTNCRVLGVDISTSMRSLAHQYVERAEFSATSRKSLETMIKKGLKIDAAYVIWVFQHSMQVKQDIDLIWEGMRKNAPLFVLNMKKRAVPTDNGWVDDGLDVLQLLERKFGDGTSIEMSENAVTKVAQGHIFSMLFRK